MFSQKMILVVEDNSLNRTLLCQILASDYNVLEAENGQEALSLLKQYGEGISLILLDIIMPVMDGYTFLSIVKADPAYSSIPVIVDVYKRQSKGNPYDIMPFGHNAMVENCFSILKTECIYRYKSKHFQEANDLIGRYIHF